MRHSRIAAWPALAFSLLYCLSACTARAAEPNLLSPPKRINDASEAVAGPAQAVDDLPLVSSRRTWGLNRFKTGSSEPQRFSPDNARPISGSGSSRGMLPQGLFGNPYSLDTWGLHPGTPVPTPVPQWRFQFDNHVRPAVAEEVVAEKSPTADEEEIEIEIDFNKGSAKAKGDDAPEPELQHSEAAKVILELMETLGRSVLDGTVFQKPSKADQKWLKELDAAQVSPREALIQYIRALENQPRPTDTEVCEPRCTAAVRCPSSLEAAHTGQLMFGVGVNSDGGLVGQVQCLAKTRCACGDNCPCHAASCKAEAYTPACEDLLVAAEIESTPHHEDNSDAAETIKALRDAGDLLDRLASELERKELYQRADQLWDMAQQLRFDARRAKVSGTAGQSSPAPPMPVVWDLPVLSPGPYAQYPMAPPMQPHPMVHPQAMPSPVPYSYPPVSPDFGPMIVQPNPSPPTPRPTYERAPREKDLEREIARLRAELVEMEQAAGLRCVDPRKR